jgi:hypothetical protein
VHVVEHSSDSSDDESSEVLTAEVVLPSKAKSLACGTLKLTHRKWQDDIKYTFELAKCDKIFHELHKGGYIKFSHTLPSLEELSHPSSRKLNQSLHTCAQDVQITRTANNMVNRYNISLNYKLESLQNDPCVQKKYYRVAWKSKHRCVFHRHNRRRGRPSLYLLAPASTLGWTPAFCST